MLLLLTIFKLRKKNTNNSMFKNYIVGALLISQFVQSLKRCHIDITAVRTTNFPPSVDLMPAKVVYCFVKLQKQNYFSTAKQFSVKI